MNNQSGAVGSNTVNNSGSSSGTKDGGLKRTGSLSTTSLSSLQASKSSSMESLESSMSISESTTDTDAIRLATVLQENAVLKSELEMLKHKYKNLHEENRRLRQASVNIQIQAEAEEEFISNTLLKKINSLKKEKEALAMNYEQEEEFLTNDLSRKLAQLRQEKVQLEQTLEQEQEQQVSKLMKKIGRLEKETTGKQATLEQLRREKIDLENTLEQEQEMLVNKLWKRMEKVEAEKRELESRLGTTPPPSPNDRLNPAALNSRIVHLSGEVQRLKRLLATTDAQNKEKMQALVDEERALKEENVRLQRRLLREVEKREAISRQLSESESSLEMEDERQFNERFRHGSSPTPYSPSPTRRSVSPGCLHSNLITAGTSGFTPPSPIHVRTSSFGSNPQLHLPPVTQVQHRRRTNSGGSSGKGRERPTTR